MNFNVNNYCEEYDYDVFVVHTEDDQFAKNEVLPRLRQAGLRCCSTEENCEIGKIETDVFEKLLLTSGKIVFILSESYKKDTTFCLFAELSMKFRFNELITLVTDYHTLDHLACTVIINIGSDNWWNDLLAEISIQVPDYCQLLPTSKTNVMGLNQVLDTRKLSNLIFLRGICLETFCCDLYGLLIVAKKRYIKVDLKQFSDHRKLHQMYNIADVCSQCSWLNHIDTTVSIAMDTCFPANEDVKSLRSDMVHICIAVMNTSFPVNTYENYRSLASTFSGQYDQEQQEFISQLFMEARYELFNDCTRKQKEPSFPEFSSFEQRM